VRDGCGERLKLGFAELIFIFASLVVHSRRPILRIDAPSRIAEAQ
jgi:hypothetical protein